MTTLEYNKKVGELVRIEWDQESGDLRIIINITDDDFKSKVLHSKDLQDLLVISGTDAMVVATRK